jgi:glutamyl/glutaminyl-tRNA synthetase
MKEYKGRPILRIDDINSINEAKALIFEMAGEKELVE